MKQLRASLYFSARRDKDIIAELKFNELEQGDINWEIKELMRDGIKYRRLENKNVVMPRAEMHKPVVYPSVDDDFNDIEIKMKELDEKEIAERLEDFL